MSESESVKPRHGLEAVQLLLGSGRLKECGPESQVVCNVDRLGAKRCRKAKVTRDSLKCVVHGFCVSASTFSERSSKSSNVSVVFSLSELVFQGPQWAAGTLTEELKERWQQVRITLRRLHATSQQWHHDYKNGRQLMDVMMTSHAFCGVLRSLILQWSSENLKILKMFWIKWENMQCFSSVALFWWFWSFEAALVQSCRSCQESGCFCTCFLLLYIITVYPHVSICNQIKLWELISQVCLCHFAGHPPEVVRISAQEAAGPAVSPATGRVPRGAPTSPAVGCPWIPLMWGPQARMPLAALRGWLYFCCASTPGPPPKRKKNGHMTHMIHMNMSPNVSNAKFAKIQAQDQAFRFRVHRGC